MEVKKKKRSGLPGLGIFKKLTGKSKSSFNTYHTAAPVDDLDLSPARDIAFSYGCSYESRASQTQLGSLQVAPLTALVTEIQTSTMDTHIQAPTTLDRDVQAPADLNTQMQGYDIKIQAPALQNKAPGASPGSDIQGRHGYEGTNQEMRDDESQQYESNIQENGKCNPDALAVHVNYIAKDNGNKENVNNIAKDHESEEHVNRIFNHACVDLGNHEENMEYDYFYNSSIIDLDDPDNHLECSVSDSEEMSNGSCDISSTDHGEPVIVKIKNSSLKRSTNRTIGRHETQTICADYKRHNDVNVDKPDVRHRNNTVTEVECCSEQLAECDNSLVLKRTPGEDEGVPERAGVIHNPTGTKTPAEPHNPALSLPDQNQGSEAPTSAVNRDGTADEWAKLCHGTMDDTGNTVGDDALGSSLDVAQVRDPGQSRDAIHSPIPPKSPCARPETTPDLRNVKFKPKKDISVNAKGQYLKKTGAGDYNTQYVIDSIGEVIQHRGQPRSPGHRHTSSDQVHNPLAGVVATNRIKSPNSSPHGEQNNRSPDHGVCQIQETVRGIESAGHEHVPVLDTSALQIFSGGPGENVDAWMNHTRKVTMSRRARSLDNMLDEGDKEAPAWLFTGSNDALSVPKKKDKTLFLKNKMKVIRRLFTKTPDKSGDHLSGNDGSPCLSVEHPQFQFQNRNNQSKRNTNGSPGILDPHVKVTMTTGDVRHGQRGRCQLHASRDSGFDQRSAGTTTPGHTDHDFLSSASEVKDNSRCMLRGSMDLSSHNIHSDSIPGYGKPCVKFSTENILDRCKSYESLSSDDGSYLDISSRSRTHRRFSSHHDLFRPKSRSHQRQSSCDNLLTSTPRSRSIYNVSQMLKRSNQARRTHSTGSDSESSFYGIPTRASSHTRIHHPKSSLSPDHVDHVQRNFRKNEQKSGSRDLMVGEGATNRKSRHRIRRSDPVTSADWQSISSMDHDDSVNSTRHRSNWGKNPYMLLETQCKLEVPLRKGEVDAL